MSLIEDAARRLEELRRAGAEMPDAAADAKSAPRANGEAPTPVAMIESIERGAAFASPLIDPARKAAQVNAAARAAAPAAPPDAPTGAYVELHLARLRSL
ncbi:MAG: hypothetical protein ABW071_08675, partial [Casimicrobiaceae bacterium]